MQRVNMVQTALDQYDQSFVSASVVSPETLNLKSYFADRRRSSLTRKPFSPVRSPPQRIIREPIKTNLNLDNALGIMDVNNPYLTSQRNVTTEAAPRHSILIKEEKSTELGGDDRSPTRLLCNSRLSTDSQPQPRDLVMMGSGKITALFNRRARTPGATMGSRIRKLSVQHRQIASVEPQSQTIDNAHLSNLIQPLSI